jgi:hypothetical protein
MAPVPAKTVISMEDQPCIVGRRRARKHAEFLVQISLQKSVATELQ